MLSNHVTVSGGQGAESFEYQAIVKREGFDANHTDPGEAGDLKVRDFGVAWPRLVGLVHAWRADELVVGLPLHMDGSESHLSREARRFGDELASRTGLPVALVDERLSSSEADHVLTLGSTPGKSRHRRRLAHRDSIAAELIVRTYLADNPAPTCNR